MVFDAGKEEILRPQAPFALIQDVFEALPIRACREWFNFIETNTEKLRGVCPIKHSTGLCCSSWLLVSKLESLSPSMRPQFAHFARCWRDCRETAMRPFVAASCWRWPRYKLFSQLKLISKQLMPLVDPSGVNKTGLINRSNVTHFSTAHGMTLVKQIWRCQRETWR